jgi:hypothetical protein
MSLRDEQELLAAFKESDVKLLDQLPTEMRYRKLCSLSIFSGSSTVADPHHLDADPDPNYHFDANPDPTYHLYADPDPDF